MEFGLDVLDSKYLSGILVFFLFPNIHHKVVKIKKCIER